MVVKYVYVNIARIVIVLDANLVLVKSIKEPRVTVAGVFVKELQKITPDGIQKLR